MAKGSITPFLSRSKSLATSSDSREDDRSQSSSPRPSSSSVFPSLRRLDTTTSTPSGKSTSSTRPASMPPSASASRNPTPLLSLRLSGPSFLDVVIRDRENKEPVYIIETVHNSTSVYRLDAQTDEATKAATITWPMTVTRSARKSGREVQMANDRWREAEDFLKLGPLGNVATRKFNIPHYPHSLKWKLIPGGHYYCSTQGAKGPFAILDSAVLNAPARLSIFHNCLDDDESRIQENYKGVPLLLLDYLVVTGLLLVTEVQEWLDRPQSSTGTVRIPGSSAASVQKWLAIIHNTPIPSSSSPVLSPAETTGTGSSSWDALSRRISGTGSISGAGSATASDYASTPSTPATSVHSSFFTANLEDIPPVPPLPTNILSSSHSDKQLANNFQHSFAASVPDLAATPSSTSLLGASQSQRSRPKRELPKPPVMSLPSRADRPPWQSTEALRSNELLISSSADPTQRSPSPSAQSSSSGSTSSFRSHNRSARSSVGRAIPPALPPPAQGLPLPPKLAQELAASSSTSTLRPQRTSQTYMSSPLGQSSSMGGLQAMNPDPLTAEEEERIREVTSQVMALHTSSSPPRPPMPRIVPGSNPPNGVHVDAGMVRVRDAAARQSYAETVYEMPPPAYDAIDFSLPHLALANAQRAEGR